MDTDGYDEDLLVNPFYKIFISKGKLLYKNAANNRWTICIPRKGTTSRSNYNKHFFESHILKPLNKEHNTYTTANDKEVKINGSFIITTKGFEDIKSVKILFEETFFNQNEESYHVLCIDHPLEGTNHSSHAQPVIPKLETLQNCIDFLWSGNGNKRTRNQLNEFILLFNSTYSRIAAESTRHSMDAANTLFTRAMQACLKEPHLRRPAMANKAFMDNLKVAVETYVMDGIYKRVFKGISSFLADKDAVFNKTTRNLTDLQLTDLQVNVYICKNIPKCKKILSNLNKFTTPLEKLYVLKLTIMAMSESSRSKPGEDYAVTSDDLLPALVFLVVKSEIPNWLANLSFMQNFHFSKSKNDEFQFYLSSAEAAIEHVRSGRLDSMISMTHTQRVKMIDTLLQGLDSNEKHSGPSPVDIFFQKIRGQEVEEVMKSLSESATNMKQITESLCHPLCACDTCKKLLASKQNDHSTVTVFSRDDIGCTALHQAAECGCEEIIYELIKKAAVVNVTNYHGSTPLHYACQRGHLKAIVILTHYGADINACDNSGNTPLHLTAANGHELCMEFLLSNDCEFHSKRKMEIDTVNELGDTALHIASRWGFGKIVYLILKQNAATSIKNKNGNTPLQCALNVKIQEIFSHGTNEIKDCFESHSPPASQLSPDGSETIKAGYVLPDSPTTSKRKKEFSRLLKAIADGNTELVRQKLGISKDPDSLPEDVYPDAECVEKLLCHPLCQCEKCALLQKKVVSEAVTINANTCNSEGVRPVHVASIHGYEDIVTILLKESAAEPNVKTKANQRTPLHLACQYNNIECVSLLIKYGARVNLKDNNGNTALHFCCTNGHIGPAILLLQGGANLHCCNQRGNTPLHDAVRWDYLDLTKLLLYYKAPLDPVNKMHLTPLQYARGSDVRMLLERAASEADDGKETEVTTKPKGVIFNEDVAVDEIFSYDVLKRKVKSENDLHHISNDEKRKYSLSESTGDLFTTERTDFMDDRSHEGGSNVPDNPNSFNLEACTFDKQIHSVDNTFHTAMPSNTSMDSTQYINTNYDTNSSISHEIGEQSHASSNYEMMLPQKETASLRSNKEDCTQNKIDRESKYEINKYKDDRRTTIAQIFAAMETDELDRLRIIAHGINNFDRRKSLKSVPTVDKSSDFLNRQSSRVFEESIFEQSSDSPNEGMMEEPFDQLLQNYASNNNVKCIQNAVNNNNKSSRESSSTMNTIKEVINEECFCGESSKTEHRGNTSEEWNIRSSEIDSLKSGISGIANLEISTNDSRHVKELSDTYNSSVTEGVCSLTISEHDNYGSLTIPDNEVICTRISQLINEAIDDNDVTIFSIPNSAD